MGYTTIGYIIKTMNKDIYSKEYQEITKRLKEARQKMGLKQEEVADKLKKPQSYISKIELGEKRLDVIELKRFSKIYKKPVDYFIK